MNPWQRDVESFHKAVGQPTAPCGCKGGLTRGRAKVRARLIREEADEVLEALEHGYLADTLDGITDLIYVCLGTAVEMGIDLEAVWAEVQASNMAKAGGGFDETGKALKPEGWVPPNIAGLLTMGTGNYVHADGTPVAREARS